MENNLRKEYMRAQSLQLCPTLRPHRLWPSRLFCLRDSPGKNNEVGSHALLQGNFPTQGSKRFLMPIQTG